MYLRQDGHLTCNTLCKDRSLKDELFLLLSQPLDFSRFEIVCTQTEYDDLPETVRDLNKIRALKVKFVIREDKFI